MVYMPLQKHEIQAFDHDSVPPAPESHSSDDEQTSNLSTGNSTKNEQPHPPLRGMTQLMKSLLLPLIAIAYLSFCYTVHNRMVPVDENDFLHTLSAGIASVKSGITSISILIIAIGLWPLKDLVENIKSEEFFRTLHTHGSGVPLAAINGISIPSSGMFDNILVTIRRHCSPYLAVAYLAGFLSLAASTLTPAALSVESVLIDTDMLAFRVGSVPADSVFNVTNINPFKPTTVSTNMELSALIAWAEISLGVQYSFAEQASADSPYLVPSPVDLDFSVPARWLTDVVALDPTCVWSKTNVSGILDYRPSNISAIPFNQTKTIFLSDVGVDLKVSPSFSAFSSPSIRVLIVDYGASNHTGQGPLSDGSIGWEVSQCVSGCRSSDDTRPVVTYNFTGIPTIQIVGADMTWEVAYLMCSPHPTIETREVRSNAQGILSVHGDKKYTKQGNLHPAQMRLLLSYAMVGFSDMSGPSLSVGDMGSRAQAAFIFGDDQINTINPTGGAFRITPLQNQTIVDLYVRILQSMTKGYLSGKLGTAYVPGRLSKPALVFRSSMSYTAASTALFALLIIFTIWAHFRAGKGEQFTLARIAMALDKSDLPSRFGQIKREAKKARGLEKADDDGNWEKNLIQEFGERNVILDKSNILGFVTP